MAPLPEGVISFICGAAFGTTSVAVGQPLDTIKTRLQASQGRSSFEVGKEIFTKEGLRGLYRGGLPLVIGGSVIRSAQFGFYENALALIRSTWPDGKRIGPLDPQVVISGFIGGIGRGLVEGPFEFMKVRRQVLELGGKHNRSWVITDLYRGSGVTMIRNAFLFGLFATHMDLYEQIVTEVNVNPPTFIKGAVCANLAWFYVWPLDVMKTQVQSGRYQNLGLRIMLRDIWNQGLWFRGLPAGLLRSTIANGSALTVYNFTKASLSDHDT